MKSGCCPSDLKKTAAVVLLLAFAGAACAKMSPEETARVFQEATVAFSEANKTTGEEAERLYERAVLGYRRLVDEGGVRNAKLYANLGNTYMMMGDVGRGILWYKRAVKLEPGNADLARSLNYARSRRIDRVEPPAEKRVMQTLLFWHYDFSPITRFVMAAVSAGLLFLALAGAVWIGRRSYIMAVSLISALVFVMMAGSLIVQMTDKRTEGVIVAGQVVARQGDGTNYPEAFKEPLHSGTEFVVIEKRPGWLRIELADASSAWVPSTDVELF